ncbi:unnamed protein product [Rotaria sp. Silwood2]|nr:unnamed protein product [Rotaria sp. Silwood2]
MNANDEARKEARTTYNESDINDWFNRMKNDEKFAEYMIEIYKQQKLDKQQQNNNSNVIHHHHQPRSPNVFISPQQTTTQHIPKLMDHLIDHPDTSHPIQQQQNHHPQDQLAKTSFDHPKITSSNNPTYSSLRRPFAANVSRNTTLRQINILQPQESISSSSATSAAATAPSTYQFHFSQAHLKRAIDNNLPCFYIKIDTNTNMTKTQMPSAMQVACWIREYVQQHTSNSINEFSLLIPAGTNRYKFGVKSLNDFLTLWNCKWPNEMEKFKIEIRRPRALPDRCAVVVRYVPGELSNGLVFNEITRSIKSAASVSKINYHHTRTTNDFRFCITDINEYTEIITIGRIAIGHLMLPVTAFIPSLKMTYCNNCWELGSEWSS